MTLFIYSYRKYSFGFDMLDGNKLICFTMLLYTASTRKCSELIQKLSNTKIYCLFYMFSHILSGAQ